MVSTVWPLSQAIGGRKIHGLNSPVLQKMFQKQAYISKVKPLAIPLGRPKQKDIHVNCAEISIDTVSYSRKKDTDTVTGQWMKELNSTTPWFKDVVPDFRVLPESELPAGVDSGTAFTSVCINVAVYLPYLISQCLKNGAVLQRAVLTHISEAADLHHSGAKADVIVNCTGLLASKLGGVMDKEVIPVRGQIVVVRNDPGVMLTVSGTDDGEDEVLYIMKRAAGGGTILGGTYQKGKWESQPDPNQALRIMKRAVELCPALTGGKGIEALSVIRHAVGLRPLRLSGVRIEKEKIGSTWVVHNYGHGGWGYQASYGCSEGAKELVDEVLAPKSKL
jgi:D-amino-acid oxidase